eukprot:CAMPEP_0171454662 /NCGR_PEP_ID=MMETSP0945-20130129/1859_1 /TAXON_ID=109269 /ORGANISM="Vaucheria litorea, Strain CCMP2940" /LENGTH=296 /DNA_ID=CAMNT_0011979731 /DNA_START=32 /DNA_END=919 /DNA_ORIENTATION=-
MAAEPSFSPTLGPISEPQHPIVKDSMHDVKRRRVMSAVTIAGSIDPSPKTLDLLPKPEDTEPTSEPKIPERPRLNLSNKNADLRKRDKRMLGSLMGHLGAARQRLDRDKKLIDSQNLAVKSVSTKQQKHVLRLQLLEEEMRRQKNRLNMALKDEREGELLIRDRNKVTELWLKAQEPLRAVMVTRALPPLTWLPNDHNEITLTLAQAQRAAVDAAMLERVKDDEIFAQKIQDDIERKYPGVREHADTDGFDLKKFDEMFENDFESLLLKSQKEKAEKLKRRAELESNEKTEKIEPK